MSDYVIEKQIEANEALDAQYHNTHCSMCGDEVEFEELADSDMKCKFCWRKGRTAGISNMGISRATVNARLDTHQNVLEK